MVFTIRATIEVMGYPEDHIKEVIQKVIENLKKEEGIKVIKEETLAPELVKEKFFSCFTDIELKINDFKMLLNFCYHYLPSNIEILDAEKIIIPPREFVVGLNGMLEKLHQ